MPTLNPAITLIGNLDQFNFYTDGNPPSSYLSVYGLRTGDFRATASIDTLCQGYGKRYRPLPT
ncbi:hypothetical protein K5F93_15160 [Pseudomonas protegens]|uniref:hypothetical protein n=1 Tax=Pseudomonas protegens TaxID=380021 RepID=UPI001C8E0963|nr:hypothetical protein [Pseudomonas protegens]QZI73482.1 hypothetical protein K5F93_15160 [Pseudomonas protegens]